MTALLVTVGGLAVLFLALVTLGMAASARRLGTPGARRWRRWLLPVQVALLVTAALGLAVAVAGSGSLHVPLSATAAVAATATVVLLVRAVAGLRSRPAGG